MSNKPFEQRARELADVALDTLEEVMRNGCKDDAPRVRAASEILDRGYGKPTQAIITIPARVTRSNALAALSDSELLQLIGELRNRKSTGGGDANLWNDHSGLETACDHLRLTRSPQTPDDESEIVVIYRPGEVSNPPAAISEFVDPLCE